MLSKKERARFPEDAEFADAFGVKQIYSMNAKNKIGRRIRDARNAEKLTLEQLAEKCECSSKHIGDVERGTVSASWPLAVKIGKALNTGVDYYLADTSDQYFDIQIDVEISNILKDCDMETRMAIRDTARRIAEYGKKIQAKNK